MGENNVFLSHHHLTDLSNHHQQFADDLRASNHLLTNPTDGQLERVPIPSQYPDQHFSNEIAENLSHQQQQQTSSTEPTESSPTTNVNTIPTIQQKPAVVSPVAKGQGQGQGQAQPSQENVDAMDFVKVESKATCLQDAMVFVSQAKVASDAAINMIKSVYNDAEENKDYIQVSKPLLDATSSLGETLDKLQEIIVNLEPEEGFDHAQSGTVEKKALDDLSNDLHDHFNDLEDGGGEDDLEDEWLPTTQDKDEDSFDEDKVFKEENGFASEIPPTKKSASSKGRKSTKKTKKKNKEDIIDEELKPPKKKRGRKAKIKKDEEGYEDDLLMPPPKKEKKEPAVDYSEIDSSWESNEYKCDRCNFTTFNRKYWEDHKAGTFHIIKCPYCGKLAPNKEQLGLHVAKEHGMTGTTGYKCDYCDKIFKLRRLYALRWHRETEHEGILYHCPLCEYNSKSPLRLQHHHQAKHENMVYLCDKCQYKTRYKRNLNSHMKNFHSGLPPVKPEKKTHVCDVCGKLGTNKYHMKCLTKQREQSGQVLKCTECDFSTYSQFSLKHHIETHRGETHMCDQCNYTTSHKINLVVHIKTVHKERKMLKCNLCEFTTKSHQYMWKHKKVTHSGTVSVLNCSEPECSFTCMFPSDLKRHHDKVHKGIRWACDLCDFSAGYKGDLNRHVKIVHQDFKVDCALCDYSTPKRYYLKEHMIKTHGIELKKEDVEQPPY